MAKLNIFKSKKNDADKSFSNMSTELKKALLSGTGLILMFLLFAALKPGLFLDKKNLINITQQIVTYSILGYGLTFCLVCGGTDLSAGASMALSGIVVVKMLVAGVPLWVCILIGLLVGLISGILNGISIEILGVVPFIATLGMQWVYRGLANVLVNGMPVYTTTIPSVKIQEQFYILGGGRLPGGIPYSVLITAVYGIILAVVLSKTRIGRQIYACGSNLEAAKLSGINAIGTRIFAYSVSGFSASICGILVASRLNSAQPTAGNGYEAEAIAAAVLGGVSNTGGEGNILNTIIGAMMMGILRNGLNLNGVSSYWQQAIIGFILVAACAVEARRHRQSV